MEIEEEYLISNPVGLVNEPINGERGKDPSSRVRTNLIKDLVGMINDSIAVKGGEDVSGRVRTISGQNSVEDASGDIRTSEEIKSGLEYNQESSLSSNTSEITPRRPITRSMHGIAKPNPRYCNVIFDTPPVPSVPKSARLALLDPKWESAMNDEYEVLIRNQTWVLIPRKQTNNVINCKWIFKVKKKEDGSVERLKARLVMNGMRQIKGTDYHEVFAPVVKPVSIRLILTIAVSQN